MKECEIIKKRLIIISFLLLFFSCDEDVDIDPTDPIALSKSIKITRSTRLSGEFPSPSSDPLAPVLAAETDTIYIIHAFYKNVFPKLIAGEAAGFYIKIKNSKSYFKVTSTNAVINYSSGNILAFSFDIEDYIKPGTFIIMYSVYDAEGRISNIVERTVIISPLAGTDSEFLSAKEWNTLSIIRHLTDRTDTTIVGQPKTFKYSLTLECYGQPDKKFEVINEYGVNEQRYTLSPDGKMTVSITSYNKTLNKLNSTNSCSLQYDISEPISNYDGRWSYFHEAKKLILLYNRFEINDQGVKTIYNDEWDEYSVLVTDNSMTWNSGDDHRQALTLK